MPTLTAPFALGRPRLCGPLTVFAIHGPEPVLGYRTLAEALALGATVTECRREARVDTLEVHNPTDFAVLLYEGEQLLGAQQDRSIDLSILVAPHSRTAIPVSCVERRRWDQTRHAEPMRPAAHAPDPALRRLKRQAANRATAGGRAAKADQAQVWHAVDERLAGHDVVSGSAALGDVYAGRAADLEVIADAVDREPGQIGSVAMIAGRPVALDLVSRADAYATLHPRLVQGYALDALGSADRPGDPEIAAAFLRAAVHAARRPVAVPGPARGFAAESPGIEGGGLVWEGELIALSAFPRAEAGATAA
jgi:hypothetical protein